MTWLLLVPLGGCSQAPASAPPALSDQVVEEYVRGKGWELDKRQSIHAQVSTTRLVRLPQSASIDDHLAQAEWAWGLPHAETNRLFSKVAWEGKSRLTAGQTAAWIDALGAAGVRAHVEPVILLRVYGANRSYARKLGLDFEEGLALVAGIASFEATQTRMSLRATQAFTALEDPKVLEKIEASGIAVKDAQGAPRPILDVIADMDRQQCMFAHGPARQAYLQQIATDGYERGLSSLLEGRSRAVACDLLGALRCKSGITARQMGEPREFFVPPPADLQPASALMEGALRAMD